MRLLGIDFGRKRLGLALSDAGGQLARPWKTVAAGGSLAASAQMVAALLTQFAAEHLGEEKIDAIVIGLPRRLNGEDNAQTQPAKLFADQVASVTGVPVHLQDERLTSVEAESRLAEHERDWKVRKKQLDAAAAAIILQDYLDADASRVGSSS